MDAREVSAAVLMVLGLGGPITQLWINVALSRRDRQDAERMREDLTSLREEVANLRVAVGELRGEMRRTTR